MKYFYLSVLIVIFASCSLTKQIEKTGYTSIAFGTGGGFTNQITTYTLSADGSLWKQNNLSNDSIFIKKVKKVEVRDLFSKAQNQGLDTLHFTNPGNIYHFILISSRGKSNKIVWGSDDNAPSVVRSYYSELSEISKH